mgnify:CR=1 FL=1
MLSALCAAERWCGAFILILRECYCSSAACSEIGHKVWSPIVAFSALEFEAANRANFVQIVRCPETESDRARTYAESVAAESSPKHVPGSACRKVASRKARRSMSSAAMHAHLNIVQSSISRQIVANAECAAVVVPVGHSQAPTMAPAANTVILSSSATGRLSTSADTSTTTSTCDARANPLTAFSDGK